MKPSKEEIRQIKHLLFGLGIFVILNIPAFLITNRDNKTLYYREVWESLGALKYICGGYSREKEEACPLAAIHSGVYYCRRCMRICKRGVLVH